MQLTTAQRLVLSYFNANCDVVRTPHFPTNMGGYKAPHAPQATPERRHKSRGFEVTDDEGKVVALRIRKPLFKGYRA